MVEGDLRREVRQNIQRLIEINCYRGYPPPPWPAGPRPAHEDQRSHQAWRAPDRGRQAQGGAQVTVGICRRGGDAALREYGWVSAARRHVEHTASRTQVRPAWAGVTSTSTFNNTIITLTDPNGNVLSWGSAGTASFKGSRKSTPFAAQMAAEGAARRAMEHGLRQVEVFVKGPGSGREAAIRSLQAAGLRVLSHPRRHADPAQRLPATRRPRLGARSDGSIHRSGMSTVPPLRRLRCAGRRSARFSSGGRSRPGHGRCAAARSPTAACSCARSRGCGSPTACWSASSATTTTGPCAVPASPVSC